MAQKNIDNVHIAKVNLDLLYYTQLVGMEKKLEISMEMLMMPTEKNLLVMMEMLNAEIVENTLILKK